MGGLARAAALFVLLGLPQAQGAPAIPIEGDQHWSDPSLVDGLLWPAPDASSTTVVKPTRRGPEALSVLTSTRADLVLHRQVAVVTSTRVVPEVYQSSTDESMPDEATGLRIDWIADIGQPQALFAGAAGTQMRIPAERCDLRAGDADAAFRFPEIRGEAYVMSQESPLHAPRAGDLAATCRAAGLHAADPRSTWIYGMQLHLLGDDGLDRTVWTGTRSYDGAAAPPGLGMEAGGPSPAAGAFFRVTQVLEVKRRDDAKIEAEFAVPAEVTIHAPAFGSIGRLRMAPSEGTLDWGPLRLRGDIAPVDAQGMFEFRRGAEDHVKLQGQTVQGPGRGAEGAASSVGSPLLVAAVAGIALALLLAGLWALFDRLSSADVLAHPRRQTILEVVQRNPGVGLGDVARAAGLRWSKAAYHASRLERAGHIRCRRLGGRIALVPAAPGMIGREVAFALLGRPKFRRIHELLHHDPGLDQSGIAARLGFHKTRVSRMLSALRDARLVEVDTSSPIHRYRARSIEAPL